VFDFEIAGGGSMVTEHLFNGLTFSTPYQRGVSALREIFKRSDKYNLTVFVLDEVRAQALAATEKHPQGVLALSVRVETSTVSFIDRSSR
jgi:hypothetical protein